MKSVNAFAIGSPQWAGVTKIIEETGELQQVLSKLIQMQGDAQHYDGSNLRERLLEEIAEPQNGTEE